jgi:parallel beta-helix repeat protein
VLPHARQGSGPEMVRHKKSPFKHLWDTNVITLKKHFSILIISLFMLGFFSYNTSGNTIRWGTASTESETTIHVPLNFTTIQAAVDNANSSDTIIISSGTYAENLIINKSLTLIGEDRDTTIVDGQGVGDAISIRSDSVTITGLTVINNGTGIRGNAIAVDHHGGIIVDATKLAGSDYGLSLLYCSNSVFSNNVIINNTYGIELINTNNNVFSNNTISGNDEGIAFDITNNLNVFFGNTLSNNGEGAIIRASSSTNFYHNNFLDQITIETEESNNWNRSGEGNYWSSYKGQDFYSGQYQNESGSDGIGDTSFDPAVNQTDYYPLMGAFSEFNIAQENGTYYVDIIANSTISNFRLETGRETGNKMITFSASGQAGTAGFCRMMISTPLMDYPYTIVVNQGQVNLSLLSASNVTNAYLYFTYPNGNQTITVISSNALQIYNSLLNKYNSLQKDFASLNATYQGLLSNYNESLQALLNNFNLMLGNLTQLQNSYLDLNSSLQNSLRDQSNSLENMRNLVYVFAAMTGAFLITTAYLSTRLHASKEPKVPVPE